MNYTGPGVYRHYKGGYYHVLGVFTPEWLKKHDEPIDRRNDYVAYVPLSDGSILDDEENLDGWFRPIDDFNEIVKVEYGEFDEGTHGYTDVPRFKKVKA